MLLDKLKQIAARYRSDKPLTDSEKERLKKDCFALLKEMYSQLDGRHRGDEIGIDFRYNEDYTITIVPKNLFTFILLIGKEIPMAYKHGEDPQRWEGIHGIYEFGYDEEGYPQYIFQP